MPELPEVETTKLGIAPHIINKKFTDVILRQRQLRWLIPTNLKRFLVDQTILAVSRRAKYLLITCSSGTLIVHLGMSGRFCLIDNKVPAQKHDHVDLVLSSGKIIRYTDPRRFGAILWTKDDPHEHKLLVNLGIEPLEAEFSAKYLFDLSRNKSTPIKALLMNANLVVGIGNIYANEALFYSKISPLRPARLISIDEYKILVANIKRILKKSIKLGGTTLKDFVGSDSKPGYFQQTLAVYGRGGEKCITCSSTLEEIRQNQRTTVYCHTCQQ